MENNKQAIRKCEIWEFIQNMPKTEMNHAKCSPRSVGLVMMMIRMFFFAVRFCATKKGDSAFWSEDAGIFLWANMMKLNNVSAIQRLLDSTVECYRFSNAFEIVIIMWAMWIVRCIFVHSLARFITFNACLYKATKNVSVEIKPFNMCIQYIHGRIRETIRCTTVP